MLHFTKNNNAKGFPAKLSIIAIALSLSVSVAQDFDPNTQQTIKKPVQQAVVSEPLDVAVDTSNVDQQPQVRKPIEATVEQKIIKVSNEPIRLTNTDHKSLDIAYEASDRAEKMPPVKGVNGRVVFQYGDGQNTVICQVNQICVIELAPNEMLIDAYVSDSARWNIEDSYSGNVNNSITMLLVRPKDVGLNSTLVLTTDKRVYSLKLKSDLNMTMPMVSFAYPSPSLADGTIGSIEAIKLSNSKKLAADKEAKRRSEVAAANARENARIRSVEKQRADQLEKRKLDTVYASPTSHLNFNYQVSGNANFKPIRVYSMGHQTILEFNSSIANGELPVLYSLRNNEKAIINYRFLDGNKYVVDSVLEKAILITGIGSKQQKITITKTNK